MADDPTLRSLFGSLEESADDSARPGAGIDVATVVRRARRRRLPARLGVGAVGLVAAGVLVVGVAAGIGNGGGGAGTDSAGVAERATGSPSEGQGGSAPSVDEDPGSDEELGGGVVLGGEAAQALHPCGVALAEVAPSSTGLTLTARFTDVDATATTASGTVTLTNTGTRTLVGWTATEPAITLARDGITYWHSNGPTDAAARTVELAPGESLDYPARLEPNRCEAADDRAERFRSDLPRVPSGDYQVSAAIVFHPGAPPSGGSDAELVTGPPQTITIR